jgi:hypothetical protein
MNAMWIVSTGDSIGSVPYCRVSVLADIPAIRRPAWYGVIGEAGYLFICPGVWYADLAAEYVLFDYSSEHGSFVSGTPEAVTEGQRPCRCSRVSSVPLPASPEGSRSASSRTVGPSIGQLDYVVPVADELCWLSCGGRSSDRRGWFRRMSRRSHYSFYSVRKMSFCSSSTEAIASSNCLESVAAVRHVADCNQLG